MTLSTQLRLKESLQSLTGIGPDGAVIEKTNKNYFFIKAIRSLMSSYILDLILRGRESALNIALLKFCIALLGTCFRLSIK